MDTTHLNSIGLVLDILGVLLLFKYGLPSNVSKSGAVYWVAEDTNESEIKKWKRYNFWSRFGLTIILIGFVCQIISNYID